MESEKTKHRPKITLSVILIVGYGISLIVFSYQEGYTIYSKLLGVAIVLLFLIKILRIDNVVSFPIEFKLIAIWFLWATLASIFASNMELSLEKLLTLIQVLAVSAAIFYLMVLQRTSLFFWMSFILASLIASIITLKDPSTYVGTDGRIAGTVGNANLFSVVLNVGLAVSIAYGAISKSGKLKLVFLTSSVLLFYMIAETGSRKGMIGSILIVVLIFVPILIHYKKKSAKLFLSAVVVGALLTGTATMYLATSQHLDRLEDLAVAVQSRDASKGDNSLEHRAALFETALDVAMKRPILGIGLDNFRDINLGLFEKTGTYSHSNYLEIFVSTGLIGLLLYTSLYFVLLYKLYRLKWCIDNEEMVGPYAVCVALTVMIIAFDFAMVSYYEKIQWFILSGLIAQIELLRRNRWPLKA